MSEPSAEASALLLRIAQHRDRDAFSALFRAYAPRIKGFYMRAGIAAERADELVQEAMLRVWRGAASFDMNRGTADTWIFRIARNVRIDMWHKERHFTVDPRDPALVSDVASDAASPEDAAVQRQGDRQLHAALAQLPKEQASVLRGVYFCGKSTSTLAEEQQVPQGTIKSRLRLAYRHLRTTLGYSEIMGEEG